MTLALESSEPVPCRRQQAALAHFIGVSPTAAGSGPLPSRLLTLYDTIAEHVGGVGEGEEGPALEALWGAVQPVRPWFLILSPPIPSCLDAVML